MAAEHDHPRHPEEQNVEAGHQLLRRIKNIQVARGFRPSENGAGKQPRRKPRVEHVRLLRNLRAPTVRALRRSLPRHRDLPARRAMPRWNAMPPPQLPRDAPVVDVAHPREVSLRVLLRSNPYIPLLHRCNCLIGQWLNLHKPLRRQARLNHCLAAVALAHVVHVILHRAQQTLRFQIGQHALARHVAVQPCIRAGLGVHVCRLVHHRDRWQSMPLPDRKVIRIMRRSHLHRARPELRTHPVIGDHRNLTPHQR